ncbi:hypothetical protein [Methanomassiliicoccus luminyensis]|uniref:hypothetical protein n=1 Tax=Methanomassiliicoccus luminyensis TaxID=1080712 RepID=UPI000379E5C1|nr:hypothetical protein [Methanomassiliicoccus luminyensis]
MAQQHNGRPAEEDEMDIEFDDDDVEDDGPVVAVGNAIVEVCFGDPEDEGDEVERTLCWVESFVPGLLTRQVADLFVHHGNVCMIMDRMTVTIPLKTVRLLVRQAGLIEGGG